MLNRLKDFIQKYQLVNSSDKLLLAVSGGKDSVAMAYLFSKLKFDFAIAHCNFKLRGEESDHDEFFVNSLAQKLDVPFYNKDFDTKKYSNDNKVSTQMAARDLRYQFFNQLIKENDFDKILTAHHKDDSIETLLLKKSRKASLEGLRGILPLNGIIVRPLLCFSSKEILSFLNENNYSFREDSSNRSSNYQRNYIRNVSLPELEKKDINIREKLILEIESNQEKFKLLKVQSDRIKKNFFYSIPFGFRLDTSWINGEENYQEIIYQILKEFGPFNWKDIFSLLKSENGKIVSNNIYRVIKERNGLEISGVNDSNQDSFVVDIDDFQLNQLHLNFEKLEANKCIFQQDVHFLDYSKLSFPLKIRKWENGDKIQPFGMKGTKKVSDFLIDLKCSTLQKENTWLLCQENKVLAIIGYRIDEYYKIDKKTKFEYKIIINEKYWSNG
jgi:tRNA(Ile)-lysidine synthase